MFLVTTTQRCGSTWLTRLLQRMTGSTSIYVNCTSLGFYLRRSTEPGAAAKLSEVFQSCSDVRVFKTHDIPCKDFDQARSGIPELKLLTISCDFKDVVVSRFFYYRYYWPTEPALGPLSEPLTKFFDTVAASPDSTALSCLVRSPILMNWAREWAAFEGDFTSANAIRLHYSELLDGTAKPALEAFVGGPVPDLPSFDMIQKAETVDSGRAGPHRFFREGRCGQWKEWFIQEESDEIDRIAFTALRECKDAPVSRTGAIRRQSLGAGVRIGIPAINRGDLLADCVRSIDCPVEHVLILANKWGSKLEASVEEALDSLASDSPECIETLEICETEGNLGVAGSFNYLLSSLGTCIIASNDTRFSPGTLEKCVAFIRSHPEHPIHCLHAMCVFNVTQRFIEEIGYFDENFWPWGWDDIDVHCRIKKRGLEKAVFTSAMGKITHDHPTQSIRSAPGALRKWMQQMSACNTAYGMKKWGIKEEHFFMLNKSNKWAIDPAVLVDAGNDWTLDLEVRAQRCARLKKQVGVETPIVYCMDRNRVTASTKTPTTSP